MRLSLKREHGLGNVLQLLPAIEALVTSGKKVDLITREDYFPILQTAEMDMSGLTFLPASSARDCDFDLDAITHDKEPSEHRVLEFCHRLGVAPLRGYVPLRPPLSSGTRIARYIVSPEAGHPAREWDERALGDFCQLAATQGSICVVGSRSAAAPIPKVHDLRGRTTLLQLAEVVGTAAVVVSMDSGTMHLAASLRTPVVALFGSVDPRFRMTNYEKVTALVPLPLEAMPNKSQALESSHPISTITANHVLRAISWAEANTANATSRICLAGHQSELRELWRSS